MNYVCDLGKNLVNALLVLYGFFSTQIAHFVEFWEISSLSLGIRKKVLITAFKKQKFYSL